MFDVPGRVPGRHLERFVETNESSQHVRLLAKLELTEASDGADPHFRQLHERGEQDAGAGGRLRSRDSRQIKGRQVERGRCHVASLHC